MSGRIILVTGGNGFLGQHVIKHLQLYGEGITEIRVLDIIPFVQKMGLYKFICHTLKIIIFLYCLPELRRNVLLIVFLKKLFSKFERDTFVQKAKQIKVQTHDRKPIQRRWRRYEMKYFYH